MDYIILQIIVYFHTLRGCATSILQNNSGTMCKVSSQSDSTCVACRNVQIIKMVNYFR